MSANSFDAKATLSVGDRSYEIFRLDALQAKFDVARLPFSLKILLENLLRNEDGESIQAKDIEALASWDAARSRARRSPSRPRVLMQDFTGVPAVVDLAAMRDAIGEMGGDESKINPLVPAELVIDHSVQVDAFGTPRRSSATPSSSSSATRSATRFCAGARARLTTSASSRRTPGSCTRSTSSTSRGSCSSTTETVRHTGRLSRYARRHRLAHDDGQRPRRARLGRRRDRSRGGDARPADVDADPAGARLRADRRAARGRDRHRPRPHGHRDAPRARRGRQVRRVLRPRPGEPAAGRPGDDRQHVARVRLDLRDLPGRRRDAALPRVHRPSQAS